MHLTARLVACLSAALLLAALAVPAAAAEPRKSKRAAAHAKQLQARKAAREAADTRSDYVERDVNKVPFGTSQWWDQMLRENRLTCCN